MNRGTLCVTFTSDWHVGTGAGRSGDVDRLIAREWVRVDTGTPFEVPVLPAKTLTGILRDAAERLAFGLDSGTDQGPWSNYVRWQFGGSGRPAALQIRPGDLSDELITALSKDPWARLGLTTTRASTAIDPDTGTAAEHTLRNIEVGRSGTVFDAVWELDDHDAPTVTVDEVDHQVDHVRFLATAAALVDGIGAKRRRGLGRCTVEVWPRSDTSGAGEEDEKPTPASEVQDLLGAARSGPDDDGSARSTPVVSATTDPSAPSGPGEALVRVPLLIEAETDLLVGTSRLGNVVESSDFIPGRLLFPIVCRALRSAGLDPAELIASGHIRVGDANPARGVARLEPVPLALSRYKEPVALDDESAEPDGSADPTATPVVNTLGRDRSEVQSKQLRNGYVDPHSPPNPADDLEVTVSARDVITHNSIDDASQRPDESTGGVYTYESLAAGQWFEGFVDLPPDAAAAVAERLLGTEHRVGASAKDDYGLVYFEELDVGVDGLPALPATPPSPESQDGSATAADELTVWCVSDVLLRDDSLAFTPTPEALAAEVSVELGLTGSWKPDRVRVRTRRIDGFHTGWGLPQPTLLAIARGSCLTLTRKSAPISPSGPAAIPRECWVGERSAEGYGRVLLNPPLLTADQAPLFRNVHTAAAIAGRFVKLADFPASSAEHDDAKPDADQRLLKTARLEALRVEILRRIAGLDLAKKKLAIPGRKPTSSAVGTLRRRLLESDGPENHPAVTWFESATQAFPVDQGWTNEMKEVLTDQRKIWGLLWESDAPLSEVEQRELWVFAVRGLVEHVERVRRPQQRPRRED